MEQVRKNFQNRWVFLVVILLGLAARFAAATLGHNFDMNSWFIVADIISHGGNVYAETPRYNYGPIWFNLLHGLDLLAGHRPEVLRYLITGVLSVVDLGICFVLTRQAGRLAGVLFFLNPVSILISGFHCQIDNLAVLFALWSVVLFGNDFENHLNRRKFCGLLLLGLSLMTKHVFFAFPIWLAVKQRGLVQKLLILIVPSAVFLLGFAPYWAQGHDGILHNVFLYHSSQTNYAYKFFLPVCIQFCLSSEMAWYGLLVLFAFICRTRSGFESLLIYSGVLVAFSPSTTNQYLAIPIALAAVFPSVPFLLYTAVSTLHICSDATNGARIWPGLQGRYDDLAIYALCIAIIWLFWRRQFLQLIQSIRQEINIQTSLLK